MDKSIRNAIERATQQARKLLDEDFSSQLEGTFDVLRNGVIAATGGTHLSALQQSQRRKIVAAIEHKRESGMNAVDAVADYVRDAAFTTLMERAGRASIRAAYPPDAHRRSRTYARRCAARGGIRCST
jgi:hypothetical protein